jgi:hypothetical protein
VSLPASLSSIEDAIQLAEVALGRDDLVAIVDRVKLVMPISGSIRPGTIIQVDQILLLAHGDDDDRLVFATRRRTGPCIALEDELADWRTMRAAHEGRDLVLADWLVFVGDGTVLSMAELAGPPTAW